MSETPNAFPTDQDIDDVLAEFEGDPRAAISALLHDLAALANDYASDTSRGYTRGSVFDVRIRKRAAEA